MNRETAEQGINIWDFFPPQDGYIWHWYGKPRSGKSSGGTEEAIRLLNQGQIVKTSWPIKWDGYDERKIFKYRLLGALGIKKEFAVFPRSNWELIPVEQMTLLEFIQWFIKQTDCTIMIDEAQRTFDSYMLTKIPEEMRNMVTATGHFNRSLHVFSQRTMTVHPTVRGNAHYFILCEKLDDGHPMLAKIFPWVAYPLISRTCFTRLKSDGVPDETRVTVFDPETGETQETDEYKYAEWQDIRRLTKEIASAYNDKYLRGNMPPSQNNGAEIYWWSWKHSIQNLFGWTNKKVENNEKIS